MNDLEQIELKDGEDFSQVARILADRDFIVFAGAGVPKATGVPDWGTMMEKLVELAKVETNINDIDVRSLNPGEYPRVAQKIFDSLKESGKEDLYYQKIKEVLTPSNSPYSTEQLEIVKTTTWIVTTNFDSTFEKAFESKFELQGTRKTLKIESLPSFSYENHFSADEEIIVYLHGKADEHFIVFKQEDYEKYYPSVTSKDGAKDIEDCLKYLYRYHTLVFIGFSFQDYYIRETLKKIYKELEKSDEIAKGKPGYIPVTENIVHFCFLKNYKKEEEREKFKFLIKELKEIKIKVILCSEYIDWIECFKLTRKLRESGNLVAEDTNERIL